MRLCHRLDSWIFSVLSSNSLYYCWNVLQKVLHGFPGVFVLTEPTPFDEQLVTFGVVVSFEQYFSIVALMVVSNVRLQVLRDVK